eukprot:14417622-Alexandrium_andersonii.AAC.1
MRRPWQRFARFFALRCAAEGRRLRCESGASAPPSSSGASLRAEVTGTGARSLTPASSVVSTAGVTQNV